jgi:hypothetical protein
MTLDVGYICIIHGCGLIWLIVRTIQGGYCLNIAEKLRVCEIHEVS